MPEFTTEVERLSLVIEIGGMPVCVHTTDPGFLGMLQERYAGFLTSAESGGRAEWAPEIDFDVELTPTRFADPEATVRVTQDRGRWTLERGDFRAEWEPASRTGWIRQSANPYSIDAVLRIVHTLVLARQGGFLLHSASAIRSGKAFLFAGVSEAGKTTISRLAPPDATLLTDEISYVRKQDVRKQSADKEDTGYVAYGTPFTGEVGQAGRKCFRTHRRSLPARQGGRESHRPHPACGGSPISAC